MRSAMLAFCTQATHVGMMLHASRMHRGFDSCTRHSMQELLSKASHLLRGLCKSRQPRQKVAKAPALPVRQCGKVNCAIPRAQLGVDHRRDALQQLRTRQRRHLLVCGCESEQ